MTPGEQQPIIDSMPGYEGQGAAVEPSRGTIPIQNFQGDPSRVLGHPSNPATQIFEKGFGGEVEPAKLQAAEHVGDVVTDAAGVTLEQPAAVPAANEYDALFDPNHEPEPFPGEQQGNNLTEAEQAKIRQEVAKNVSITQAYGSQYFNNPK